MDTIALSELANIDRCPEGAFGVHADVLNTLSEHVSPVGEITNIVEWASDERSSCPDFLRFHPAEHDQLALEIDRLQQYVGAGLEDRVGNDQFLLRSLFNVVGTVSTLSSGRETFFRWAQAALLIFYVRHADVSGFLLGQRKGIRHPNAGRQWIENCSKFLRLVKKESQLEALWGCFEGNREKGDKGAFDISGCRNDLGKIAPEGNLSKSRIEEFGSILDLFDWVVLLRQRDAADLAAAQEETRAIEELKDNPKRTSDFERARDRYSSVKDRRDGLHAEAGYVSTTLNQTGEVLQLTDECSGNSFNALKPEMVQRIIQHLVSELDEERPAARKAAAAIIVLSALTGRRMHDLIDALNPAEARQGMGAKIDLTIQGKMLRLNLLPPDLKPGVDVEKDVHSSGGGVQKIEGYWSILVTSALAKPLIDWHACVEGYLRDGKDIDAINEDVVIELCHYWFALRAKCCNRYTETHLRLALVEELLGPEKDIPLVQLMTGDHLGQSIAPQHYTQRDSLDLSRRLVAASNALGGDGFLAMPGGKGRRIGTEKTQKLMALMDSKTPSFPLAKLSPVEARNTTKSEAKFVERFNNATNLAGAAFLLASSHRNNTNLQLVSAQDIDVHHGLAIFGEKPTGPEQYRRICGLAPSSLTYLQECYASLVDLDASDFGRKLDSDSQKLLKRSINGNGSLFLTLRMKKVRPGGQSPIWQLVPWDGRVFWKQWFGEKMSADGHRHMMSTWLRRHCKASLVETQLGHNAAISLLDECGVVAAVEFAHAISDVLERFLEEFGIAAEHGKLEGPKKRWIASCSDAIEIAKVISLERNLHRKDDKRLQAPSQRNATKAKKENGNSEDERSHDAETNSAEGPVQFVDKKFSEFFGYEDIRDQVDELDDDLDAPLLSRKAILNWIAEVRNHPSMSIARKNDTLRRLKKRIYELDAEDKISVGWPPPEAWNIGTPIAVTSASLVACDVLSTVRETLDQFRDNSPSLGMVALDLIVNADVPTKDALQSLLENLHDGKYLEGGDFYAVPYSIPGRSKASDVNIAQDVDVSFCVSGPALHSVLGFIVAPGSKVKVKPQFNVLEKEIEKLLPEKLVVRSGKVIDQLIELVRLERQIVLPQLLARVMSSDLLSRQLELDRLMAVVGNFVVRRKPLHNLEREISEGAAGSKQTLALFEEIKLQFNDYVAGDIKVPDLRKKFEGYSKHKGRNILELMLLKFALMLCGPRANLRERPPKPYNEETVRDYWAMLAPTVEILGRVGVEGYSPSDFSAEFRKIVPNNKTQWRKAWIALRFFAFSGRKYDLAAPPIHDIANRKIELADLDAACLSDAEIDAVLAEIQANWEPSSVNAQMYLGGVQDLHCLRRQSEIGARASEMDYFQLMDVFGDTKYVQWILRNRPNRKLKTTPSNRHPCSAWLSGALYAYPDVKNRSKYVFGDQYDGRSSIAARAMIAVTGLSGSRRHHFRHTKITKSFIEIFEIADPIERAVAAERFRTGIGHATLDTSVQNYGHAMQLCAVRIRRNCLGFGAKRRSYEDTRSECDAILTKAPDELLFAPPQGPERVNVDEVPLEVSSLVGVLLSSFEIGFEAAATKYRLSKSQAIEVCRTVQRFCEEDRAGFADVFEMDDWRQAEAREHDAFVAPSIITEPVGMRSGLNADYIGLFENMMDFEHEKVIGFLRNHVEAKTIGWLSKAKCIRVQYSNRLEVEKACKYLNSLYLDAKVSESPRGKSEFGLKISSINVGENKHPETLRSIFAVYLAAAI